MVQIFCRLVVIAAIISGGGLAAQGGVAWNQFNEVEYNGIQRNVLKLSLGPSFENPSPQAVTLLSGRFQYLINDYFGIRGETGIPLASKIQNYGYLPLTLGGDVHLFPRSMFDIYLGGDGGFLYVDIPQRGNGWFSRTSLHVGLSFYFWGVFFLEGEVRYNVQHFAGNPASNLSALGYNAQIGFYF